MLSQVYPLADSFRHIQSFSLGCKYPIPQPEVLDLLAVQKEKLEQGKSPYYKSASSGLRVSKKSLVISKLSQLLAMLGATFSRLGTMPLYIPLIPSCVMMTRIASKMDLYW